MPLIFSLMSLSMSILRNRHVALSNLGVEGHTRSIHQDVRALLSDVCPCTQPFTTPSVREQSLQGHLFDGWLRRKPLMHRQPWEELTWCRVRVTQLNTFKQSRVPTAQGKQGKWLKNIPSGKTQRICKFCQNTRNLVCLSCKFPDS